MREASHRYEDPLDRVWATCAARVGLRLRRAGDVNAATDGRGTLTLATDDGLDADDCLAQMVFHELCHSLVQGAESFDQPDWGLDNFTDVDALRERACLRVQATLARPHGLRAFFAPTTDYRAFYDALPEDALPNVSLPGDAQRPEVVEVLLARRAAARAGRAPWGPHLEDALTATAAIVTVAHAYADGPPVPDARALGDGASRAGAASPSLYTRVAPRPPRHPRTRLPLAVGARASETCGTCAWRATSGLCRQAEKRVRTLTEHPACERWEPALDCLYCGACCREAFGAVTVRADELVRGPHAALVRTESDGFRTMRRVPEQSATSGPDDTRCVALRGDGGDAHPFTCDIYGERPQTCHAFTLGSAHCLVARRRVGLSR
jgi:hypothetical protein